MTRYYLQAPDGQCLYSVVSESHGAVFVGSVGSPRHLGGSKYIHSVVTDGPVDTIDQLTKSYEYHDSYTLTDPDLKSKALPVLISKDRYDQLAEHLRDNYRRGITVTDVVQSLSVAGHIPLPSDLPLPSVPSNWKPSSWVHIYGPFASHLVGGVLSGFRAHIKEIGKKYGDCYDRDSSTKMKFNVRSFWSPPRHAVTGKGRNAQRTQTWMTSSFELPVLDDIAGVDLADAQRCWDARTAEIVEVLESHLRTKTCGHCEGRGFLSEGSTS